MLKRTLLMGFLISLGLIGMAQTYDVRLDSIGYNYYEYPIIPLTQIDSFGFYGRVINDGTTNVTGAKVNISYSATDSIVLGNIASYDSAYGITYVTPTSTGVKRYVFEAVMDQTDNTPNNNKDSFSLTISDTTMARETGSATGGLGYNGGAGEIGNVFRLTYGDTITSISFYINTPTGNAGDSVKAHLRGFSSNFGGLIESTNAVAISANQNWYTLPLKCPTYVPAGEYLVTAEQMVSGSNLSLGYSLSFFTDSTAFYNGGAGWTPLEVAGFEGVLLVRPNFGRTPPTPDLLITASLDTVCPNEYSSLQASSGKKWKWTPTSAALTPNSQSTLIQITQSTVMTVTADYGCGISQQAQYTVYAKPSPTGTVSADTTICEGGTAVLSAEGGSSYTWTSGPTNTNWSVMPTVTTTYYVTIDSTNGCSDLLSTQVTVNKPVVMAYGDTAVCKGEEVTVGATGTSTYHWTDGPSTAEYTLNVNENETLVVTGFDDLGCAATDSVDVMLLASPDLTPMADTGACFTKYVTLIANGTADNYEWSTGSDSASTTVQALTPKEIYLYAYNDNGCDYYDTIFVDRYIPPFGTITEDTTICEKDSVDLTAGGGSTYEWDNGMTGGTIRVSPDDKTTYNVTIISDKGCEDYENVTVSVDPLPLPSFTLKTYQDSVTFRNTSQLYDSIHWDFGDGNTSTEEQPYNIYDTTGSYTITLTVYNGCGAVDSAITINVIVPQTGSVNGILAGSSWSVNPNPTRSNATVNIMNDVFGDFTIQVIDGQGKVLLDEHQFKSARTMSHSIDLTSFTSGVYLVKVSYKGSSITQKLIKY